MKNPAAAVFMSGALLLAAAGGAIAAPPVLTVPGPQAVNEQQQLSFSVSATDPDGGALTFSLQPNSADTSTPPFFKGIYILRNDTIGNWTTAQLTNVAAFALRPDWSSLQPTATTFDFSRITNSILSAVNAGKKVTLHVSNGISAPAWIYSAPYNVPQFYFLMGSIGAGGSQVFAPAIMPVPWNDTYLTLYLNLLTQLKNAIVAMGNSPKTGGPYWNEVFLFHVVGPTEGGAEIFLPSSDDGSVDTRGPNLAQGFPGNAVHNYASEWMTAGYTAQVAFDAFKRVMDFHATNFPGKYAALDTVPKYLFNNESIDTNGDGTPEFYPAGVLDAVVVYGRARFGRLLTIQIDALNSQNTSRYDYGLIELNRTSYGVTAGFQTWLPSKRPPNNETLRATLQEGLRRGASYLEVYGPDVTGFPADIQFAHDFWQGQPVSPPPGASIDATSGLVTWTPGEADGPGSYLLTVRVTDSTGQSDIKSIPVTVSEVNSAPVLTVPGEHGVALGASFSGTATSADSDIPAQTLQFSLVSPPAGASINASSGALTFTPASAGNFTLTVKVNDNGVPALSNTKTISIVVVDTNSPPAVPAALTTTLAQGAWTLGFRGEPGRVYRVEASATLAPASWATIGNATSGNALDYIFTDASASNYTRRFYRVVTP